MSMVVTLKPGSVTVRLDPEAGWVPAATGATGLPAEACGAAGAAVIG